MVSWAALASLALSLTPRAQYDLGVRSEARAAVDAASSVSSVVDLTPRAGLRLELSSLTLHAGYYPRFALYNLANPGPPEVLHSGTVGAEYAFTDSRRLFVRQEMSYGMRELTLLGPAETAAPGETTEPRPESPVPDPAAALNNLQLSGTVPFFSSSTTAGVVLSLGPLWLLVASGGYDITGGSDPASQAVLPSQRGPRFDGLLSYLASPRDTLTTAVSLRDSLFSNGRRAGVLMADERWTRGLARNLTAELRGGVSAYRARREDGTVESVALPLAGAAVSLEGALLSSPVRLRMEVEVVPYVDPFAGVVYHRLETAATAGWRYEDLTLAVRGAGSMAVTGWERRGQVVVTTDVGATYPLAQNLQLEGGFRAAWQGGVVSVGSPFSWGCYVAVAFTQAGAL